VPSTSVPAPPITAEVGFAALGVPQPLVTALREQGRTTAFPIQVATLPDALAGRDVLGRARTGSGKTIAFAVPTVARLAASPTRRPHRPRALVLVPTRELANQVQQTLLPLTRAVGLRSMTIFGGVSQGPQVTALRRGVDICVATPGRLEDLIGQGHVRLDAVEVTVIDEADHMADLGFLPAVRRLLDRTPPRTQRLLFSATLDGDVDVLVRRYLHDPARHSVDEAESSVPAMTHRLVTVDAVNKAAVVHDLLAGQPRTLAFTRTKHAAKKLARRLSAAGVPSADLHGNLSQAARTRNLSAFHEGQVRVLVATDIAARGIHVDDVNLVVHVDPPAEHKAYLHRSGRTARAGNAGTVVTVATLDQRTAVRTLLRSAKVTAVEQHVTPAGRPARTR
jgi:superfamily II DNA/RNA helicase